MIDLLALLDAIAADPQALERLRQLVAGSVHEAIPSVAAYTPRTLAAELGRSERSVRDAIARGELAAVKRGKGWVISADAVAAWTRAPARVGLPRTPRRSRARSGSAPGPMTRALRDTFTQP